MLARRWAPWIVALSVSAAGLRLVVWPVVCERQAAILFSALAVCLAGNERTPAGEAPIRARRLHPGSKALSLQRCSSMAEDLAGSTRARSYSERLTREAAAISDPLWKGQLPGSVADLWHAGGHLPWIPPQEGPLSGPPVLLLDQDLPAMREALNGYVTLRRDIDDQPLDHTLIDRHPTPLVVRGDARGPQSIAAWGAERQPRRRHALINDGRVTLRGAVDPIDLGPGRAAAVVERFVVWIHEGEIRARRLDTHGPDLVAKLPAGERPRIESCRRGDGHVVVVDMSQEVVVFHLREASLEAWGSSPRERPPDPAHTGDLHISCDDTGARLAWAVSEPPPGDFEPRGRELPKDPGPHRVVVVSCAASGCARREGVVGGIDVGWASSGGYGSSWYRMTPEVVSLGARVLVVWQSGSSLRYRLAPLDALTAAPSPWIAEISRPKSDEQPDPRTIAWPELEFHTRGDVALLLVRESRGPGAGFLVRFDGAGSARVITPPPR